MENEILTNISANFIQRQPFVFTNIRVTSASLRSRANRQPADFCQFLDAVSLASKPCDDVTGRRSLRQLYRHADLVKHGSLDPDDGIVIDLANACFLSGNISISNDASICGAGGRARTNDFLVRKQLLLYSVKAKVGLKFICISGFTFGV